MAFHVEPTSDEDLRYHYDTYRAFVRWTMICAAHALLVLALLAYVFT